MRCVVRALVVVSKFPLVLATLFQECSSSHCKVEVFYSDPLHYQIAVFEDAESHTAECVVSSLAIHGLIEMYFVANDESVVCEMLSHDSSSRLYQSVLSI